MTRLFSQDEMARNAAEFFQREPELQEAIRRDQETLLEIVRESVTDVTKSTTSRPTLKDCTAR